MPQLKTYHRPKTINEALQLLTRSGIDTVILGGGTYTIGHTTEGFDEVIDLQDVGLTSVDSTETDLSFGAMVTLQSLVDDDRVPPTLRDTAYREGPNTLRNVATIAGLVAETNWESEFLATLLAFDAVVVLQTKQGVTQITLPEFFGQKSALLTQGLITQLTVDPTGKSAATRVGRTPADRPIVVAVARLGTDNEIRLALAGVADTPVLLDPDRVKAINPPPDFRGSSVYRRQMALILSKRVLAELKD